MANDRNTVRTYLLHRSACRARYRGFTLLEVILSLGLMITLLSGVFGFYWSVLRARNEGSTVARDVMMARAILERMANELRHATDILPGDGHGFHGDNDQITIVYVGMPTNEVFKEIDPMRDDPPPTQCDLRRVTYQLLESDEYEYDDGTRYIYGLFRSEQRTFDPNPSFVIKQDEDDELEQEEPEGEQEKITIDELIQKEIIAPEFKYLKFEYFDGAEWHDRWRVAVEVEGEEGEMSEGAELEGEEPEVDSERGELGADLEGPREEGEHVLPQAVRITLGKERPDREEREFDINQLDDMREEQELKEHHGDRFTIVVHLLQADQSLMSSRKYGSSKSKSKASENEDW